MNGHVTFGRRHATLVGRYVVYLPVLLSMFVMVSGITQCNANCPDGNGGTEPCISCSVSPQIPCKARSWNQPADTMCDAALHPDAPDGTPCDLNGVGDGVCMSGVCEAGQATLVLEQASKQVGSALVCSNVLLPGEDYSFELSPLVVESDGNNNVSLSGQLRVTGSCSAFLVPPVRLDSAEVSVSVAGATPVTLTGVVAGLPAEVPDIGSTCDGLFDITVAVPTELTVSETVVDFTPTDIVASISKSGFGSADVSKSNSGCDFVPDTQLPSVVSFSAFSFSGGDYPTCLTAEEVALADAINTTRLAYGLQAVPVDTRLVQTARANAEQFAFDLTYACPSWPCYGYLGSYADNGAGFFSASEFWDAILTDTTNPVRVDSIQNVILSPSLEHLGVGYYEEDPSPGLYTRGWSFAAGKSAEPTVLDGPCEP